VSHVERKHGPVWYVKYRLPSGKQVQKKLGPARTERGRPPAGYFTKRTAEAQLRTMLEDARRGTLQGSVETGVTFAEAAAEWPAVHRRGSLAQVVDAGRLPLRAECASVAGVQGARDRVDNHGGGRPVATLVERPVESLQERAPDSAPRNLPPPTDGLGAAGRPTVRKRQLMTGDENGRSSRDPAQRCQTPLETQRPGGNDARSPEPT
jgi:hypothetical protein